MNVCLCTYIIINAKAKKKGYGQGHIGDVSEKVATRVWREERMIKIM